MMDALTFLKEYASFEGLSESELVEELASWIDENPDVYDRMVLLMPSSLSE